MMCLMTSNLIMHSTDGCLYSSHTQFFQMSIEIIKRVSVYLIFGTGCRRSVALTMRLYTVLRMFMLSLSRIRSDDERVDAF